MSKNVLLVVGMGPGISLSGAKRFAKEGYSVAFISRSEESINRFEKELASEGIEAKGFQGDASSEESLRDAITAVTNHFGKVDVLLYNAASSTPGKPTTLRMDDLIHDFKVSVAGALTSVKEVLPSMNGGSILLTGGGLGLYPYADYASLAIGKAGIRNLAYSLQQELSPKGVYVGTLTIKGFVQEGTFYSAENIADAFYNMHVNQQEIEMVYEEQE